ncbi:DNA glycosylase AlkZ-like family protein [Streptomyces sp. 7-21]|uniref:DNA glycosylase AlkZ-like family protein n=1 Tax=Streptomyces sp. 7-21 TaxID=2802283 RepID=UPI00191D973B|nr:crosslink repair DNA glycosylase YcaQ family protein [Streptomyces sp. 7-21]MBL1067580.1 winged helix DNA-binding domain-containing protein [Streptomyces sp. 7-21]
MLVLRRARLLAYRYAAHDLAAPAGRDPASRGAAVLATGLQDRPVGLSAALALRLRTGAAPPAAPTTAPTALVHSLRGAVHLHDARGLPGLAAALGHVDTQDLLPASAGPVGAGLAARGVAFSDALAATAAAMRQAVTGGRTPTKGELSGEVSRRVDARLVQWCQRCGAAHVDDQLFRLATLQAGLVIEPGAGARGRFRYRRAGPWVPEDPLAARARLVRAFLTAAGPARPAALAVWLGCAPAAARRWWELVLDELRQVTVGGARYWVHADQLERLTSAPDPGGVRLLPPYDPYTEVGDRALLVPDPARRRAVWRAAGSPGVVLVDGEIAGVWRQRRARGRVTLRIRPFAAFPARRWRAAEADAAAIAAHFGAELAGLTVEDPA